jgi:hypothetical protein
MSLVHLIFYPRALEKLFTILNVQHKGTLGKIKGLFRQPKAAERLETCKQELSRMVELFKVYQMKHISMHIQIIGRLKLQFQPWLKWGK